MNNHLKAIAAVATALVITGGTALAIGGTTSEEASMIGAVAPATTSTTIVDLGVSTSITVGGAADGNAAEDPGTVASTSTTVGSAVNERLSGAHTPLPGEGAVDPLGTIDTSGLVPEGLDLAAFPDAPQHGTGGVKHQGPGSLSAGPGCAYQCIESGIAYPRGFGAELVVKTKVPADLWLSVIADYDNDGDYDDFSHFEWSSGKVKEQSWPLDHLEPGQTYYATVTATDEHGDTSYGFGQFTTLSHRSVEVSFNDVDIQGGPNNIEVTNTYARIGGGDGSDFVEYPLGIWLEQGGVDRYTELALGIVRHWDAKVCEYADPAWLLDTESGDLDISCLTWNTAKDTVDLDRIPAGKSRWTTQSFDTTIEVDDGEGDALPPGYGQPRWFYASTVATVYVTYS